MTSIAHRAEVDSVVTDKKIQKNMTSSYQRQLVDHKMKQQTKQIHDTMIGEDLIKKA